MRTSSRATMCRSSGHSARLAALPDLRAVLGGRLTPGPRGDPGDLDVHVRYNHLTKAVELSIALAPELAQLAETTQPPGGGRRKVVIAGARYERVPSVSRKSAIWGAFSRRPRTADV